MCRHSSEKLSFGATLIPLIDMLLASVSGDSLQNDPLNCGIQMTRPAIERHGLLSPRCLKYACHFEFIFLRRPLFYTQSTRSHTSFRIRDSWKERQMRSVCMLLCSPLRSSLMLPLVLRLSGLSDMLLYVSCLSFQWRNFLVFFTRHLLHLQHCLVPNFK